MLFVHHPKETAIIFALTCAGSLAFYAYTTYIQKFLVNTAGFSKDAATAINAGALTIYMLILPLVGWASDKVGRRTMLAVSFGAGALLTYPIFSALAGADSALTAFLLSTALVVILSGYSAVSAVVKAELFPAHVRALGVALPYAMANALFGGTAEYAALGLRKAGVESAFYVYVALMMAMAAIVAARLRDTNRLSLIRED